MQKKCFNCKRLIKCKKIKESEKTQILGQAILQGVAEGLGMQNKCFNCLWFFSCSRQDKEPNKENCEYFKETNVKEVTNEAERRNFK